MGFHTLFKNQILSKSDRFGEIIPDGWKYNSKTVIRMQIIAGKKVGIRSEIFQEKGTIKRILKRILNSTRSQRKGESK